jgi:hypothetical protein
MGLVQMELKTCKSIRNGKRPQFYFGNRWFGCIFRKKLELIKLTIRATGGSDVKLEIDADEIDCSTTGGSDVTLIGNTTVLKASSTGGSDLKANKLRSSFCSVSATGGSDAYVWAEKEISISATGGSDVYISGNARVVKKSVTGGSDVH